MSIEWNRTSYSKLLQLYVLTFILSVLACAYEVVAWSDFATEFDKLTITYFGEPTDAEWVVAGTIALPALVAHMCSIVGLFRYRSWARILFWISLIVLLLPAALPGLSVSYTGFATMILEAIGSALFGMIVMISYSKDHGGVWFANGRNSAEG